MEQTGCDDGSLQDSAPSCVLGRTCPSAWGEEECLPRAAGLASTPRAYGQEPGNSWDSDDLTEAGRAALSGPHPAPARSWPRQRSRSPSGSPHGHRHSLLQPEEPWLAWGLERAARQRVERSKVKKR